MVFKKAKLFWKHIGDKEIIDSVLYDDSEEYYTFLRKCKAEGYRQVIITTEIMIQVIRMAVIKEKLSVYKIEFAEEDCDLENDVQSILKAMENNPANFSDLLEKIKFMSEQSSIDIRKLYIKGKYIGEYATSFFLQSNGILGINAESFGAFSKKICTSVEGCLLE